VSSRPSGQQLKTPDDNTYSFIPPSYTCFCVATVFIFNFIHRKKFDSSINKEKIQKQKDTHNQHFSVNKDLYMAAEDKYNKEQTEI